MGRANKDSKGAELLRARGLTQEEIAAVVSKSHVAVGHWLRGRSRPDPESRKKLDALYAIPVASWDEPLSPAAPAASSGPAPRKAPDKKTRAQKHPDTALGMAAKLKALCHQMFDDIEASNSIRERATVAKSLASVIAQLAKVTNEYGGAERFVDSPVYHRLVQAVLEGIRGHGENVARDVGEALRRAHADVHGGAA